MTWSELADWWASEVVSDPAYEEVVTPLLFEVFSPVSGSLYLDLGCGEGRVMRSVAEKGGSVVGVEMVPELARQASRSGSVAIGQLPEISFIREDSVDRAYCVLVIEHLKDASSFFSAVARSVKPGGSLSLVMNHPVWTAPDSTPITDTDGEVLWRPGDYFSDGSTDEHADGERTVRFHHRTISELLNQAAGAGWSLVKMVEKPHHEFESQSGIPRLLACHWRLIP